MEIFTGIDIVENKRILHAIEKFGNKFLSRVFTKKEISYCYCKKNLHQCLAARFAAKEAFIKAFFQAFKIKLFPSQIEIIGKEGYPAEIFLHLPEKEKLKIENSYKSTLSISHERNYSVAVVIIYK
ncbi:MAG: holo-[acyl-carrier-protein] synthase [Aquificae bacterium]|nr:holo-[acyl-carrier-protein] synthase [Aquificota bacterium]